LWRKAHAWYLASTERNRFRHQSHTHTWELKSFLM
jgi:hypothetical protein